MKTLKLSLFGILILILSGNIFAVNLKQDTAIVQENQEITNDTDSKIAIEISEATTLKEMKQKGFKIIEPQPSFSWTKIFRGFLGLFALIFIAWIFSKNRKAINWRVVFIGLSIQLLLAFSVLQLPFVQSFFEFVGKMFIAVLDSTKAGSEFLLGDLLNPESYGFIFAFQILPTIIFFSALTSLLFYLGIIQKIVYALAWLMTKAMQLSGAESLSVAGNIFLGQTESPLLIKAYLASMNKSEVLLVMIGGMATLAGGVLAAYIGFLGGDDPAQKLLFAKHLLTASVMAAPGAVVASKILFPQTENIKKEVVVDKQKIGNNILDAISNGTTEGIKLAVNVAGMLLVFIAFMALINMIFFKFGNWTNLNLIIAEATNNRFSGLSVQYLLGNILAPLMWVIGVPSTDILQIGQLLGEKIILNEFIGYTSLSQIIQTGNFSEIKSIIMATYMLCGFANFGSIGIQIGGIGSLAPNQRVLLSKLGLHALLGGTIASLFSATIVGMILG